MSKMNVTIPTGAMAGFLLGNDTGNESMTSGVDTSVCREYDFVIEAVFMGLLCVFGFCGNILSILCLNRDKSKTATPFLLVSLELADTLFLITVLILRVLTTLQTYTYAFPWLVGILPYLGKYVFPCAMISETATIYLTLLVTVNRYISVCRPYEVSDFCSMRHAQKHVIIVVLCSIAYNIPRFFEYELDVYFDERMNKNISITVPTSLMNDSIYQIIYSNILYFLILFCFPLVTLIILNTKLIKALKKAKQRRAQLLSATSSDSNRSEDDITLILIVVVLVFVVCQTPALVTQTLLVILPDDTRHCPNAFFFYERISDLLVVANSAVNFIVYCFCSRKFRQILISLVCKRGIDSPEPSHASRHYRQVPTKTVTAGTMTTITVLVTNGEAANANSAETCPDKDHKENNCETKVSAL